MNLIEMFFAQNRIDNETFSSRYPLMIGMHPSGSHEGLDFTSHASLRCTSQQQPAGHPTYTCARTHIYW